MKKLRLELETLSVATFETGPAREERGTVQANHATPTCAVTSGIDSCWCSEFVSCDCTI
jgi:hypothetical protein